ncbi:hypothetical protein B0A52_08435 [Exophiala mesophila]|uniref:Uncharacterized protein n=1 Tax=Exophiala mesophila TaxID=212818 RepID=A0A438MW95_EXOME|nr:hypothetical protein B0A52_08435 [Exophiala mesophila]
MPALRDLVCHVQWASTDSPFPEYATQYGDGVVETYITIPSHPQSFTVRLFSTKFIADGLSMVVFIDGNYQCNRNRVNLRPPKDGQAKHLSEIDFTVRQKEKPMGDGKYMGREWRFDNHNIVPNIPEGVKESHFDDLGTIEVLVLRCCTRNPIEIEASPASSAEHSTVLNLSPDVNDKYGWFAGSEKQDQNSKQTATLAGGMFRLFDGPADYRPRYYPNSRDASPRDNHHWDDRYAHHPLHGSSRPPHTSQHSTSSYFTDYANPHSPHNPHNEARLHDATRASRRVHFDFGDHGDQRVPRSMSDHPRPSSRPQWVDSSSHQQFREGSDYYNPEVRFRGPDPYTDHEAYDGIRNTNVDTHRPVYQGFPEQYRPTPQRVRMPSSASLPPGFWPNPVAGRPMVPLAQQRPSSTVPAAPSWVPGLPHIPVWLPPSAMPMPPPNSIFPLYQFPNSANVFPGHNVPAQSNLASVANTAQSGHAQNTPHIPESSAQRELNNNQQGNNPPENGLSSWGNNVNVNNAPNNDQATETPGQPGWAGGGDFTVGGNTASSGAEKGTARSTARSIARSTATSRRNSTNYSGNAPNQNLTDAAEWTDFSFQKGKENTGESSNTPAHSNQESQQQPNYSWANDNQNGDEMNKQADGTWSKPQNGQEAASSPTPLPNDTTPTPLGRGSRDLYGPHGAYFMTKAFAETDAPPDAEEEPRYDVPAPIAQAKGSSKQVQPGKGYLYYKKRCAPQYIDSLEEPYARFVFKYRTKEQMKNEVGIEIDAEPTGDDEVNALENLDKAALIQLVIRAKGALGGQIPEGRPRVPSGTPTTAFDPEPVEPPSNSYLRYNLPPSRNISNPGLGISPAINPPQISQKISELAKSNPGFTTFNQEMPPSTEATNLSNTFYQEQSSQRQPSSAGLEFLGSGAIGQESSTQGKPPTPPLGPVSPDLPANPYPNVPPPPLFPCGNESGAPTKGW